MFCSWNFQALKKGNKKNHDQEAGQIIKTKPFITCFQFKKFFFAN